MVQQSGDMPSGEERRTSSRRRDAERRVVDRRSEPNLRGRRRSDESLASEIREILTEDPELDVGEIEVEVEDGAVRLMGEVENSEAKLLAEELAESVAGVREVRNRLRVARSEE